MYRRNILHYVILLLHDGMASVKKIFGLILILSSLYNSRVGRTMYVSFLYSCPYGTSLSTVLTNQVYQNEHATQTVQ